MCKPSFVLLVLAVLVGGAASVHRAICLSDEATAALVLKRGPALWIERLEAWDWRYSQQIVLDSDELSLAYDWLYFPLMRAATTLALGLAVVAALLLALSRVRKTRKLS